MVSRETIVLLFLLDSPVSSYPSYPRLIYDQVLSLFFLLTGYLKLSLYIIINVLCVLTIYKSPVERYVCVLFGPVGGYDMHGIHYDMNLTKHAFSCVHMAFARE
jgi:hypothetical protein